MSELYRAVVQRKPLLALLEPDVALNGGLDEAGVRAYLTDESLDHLRLRATFWEWNEAGEVASGGFDNPPDGRDVGNALFASRPVEWNRLPHFQDCLLLTTYCLLLTAYCLLLTADC